MDRIKQLLIILIDNAVKYTTANGRINVILFQNGHNAMIEISDTGIGIGQEEITRVFDRFYRGKQSRLYNPDGSGLGLSIAKLITEEHGGTISAESQLKRGSIFRVSLPSSAAN
ncbi:Sensor protein SrrB [compost metagenome]